MKKILALVLVALLGLSLVGFAKGKVAVVLDVGGRGDLSFNDMGFKGTDQAAKDFNLEMVEVQCATAEDYYPNIQLLAQSGEYDLIICVGFLLGDALGQAAKDFPNQKFAVIDVDWITAPNIMNYVFRENEMSALVGALGAMVASQYGYKYVGLVLGIEIPVLYHFEAGYRFGINWGLKKYDELGLGIPADVKLLYTYTGTFSDIAKGKAAAQAQLEQGAVAIYNVAGPLGIGMLEAVTEKHVALGKTKAPTGAPYYFGVDANQDYLGMGLYGLASGMKRVDTACYKAVEAVVKGTFLGGVTSLGLKEGGVAISKKQDLLDFIEFGKGAGVVKEADVPTIIANWEANRNAIPAKIWEAIDELEQGILDGTMPVPTASTGPQMQVVRAQYPL